jgi:uncharacterized glyoxalase superfamily protein PhnB
VTDRPRSPVFNQLNLIVAEVAASARFYRLLGLDIDPGNGHHLSVRFENGTMLEIDAAQFARVWDPGWKGPAGGQNVIGFGVAEREDVDAIYTRMIEAGYRSQLEPQDAFWGSRYAILEDPDGNPVGLMSPVDPARKSPMPQF